MKTGQVYLFDSRIDPGKAVELEDGSARMDVRLAPEGESFTNGRKTFSLTKEDLQAAVANFNKRGAPVPVTIGHYPDEERQHQPAAAWIERLYSAPVGGQTYLMGTMRFLKKTWESIKGDEFKFLSMEFWTSAKDQKGAAIGLEIDGAAILNYPFFPLRFDQSSARGECFLWLTRFGAGKPSEGEGGGTVDLNAGTEIREVDGRFCIFNSAGENLGCHTTIEAAEAARAAMTGRNPGEKERGDMGKKVEVEEAEMTKLKADREELQALKKKGTPEAGKVAVEEAELTQLRKDSEKLKSLETVDGKKPDDVVRLSKDLETEKAERIKLEKTVKDLEAGRAEDQKKLKAQRIRTALATLTTERNVHIRLGDHKIETDEGAINFLATKPFGVESVEGLEKLAGDLEASAHLPRVKLGDETRSGVAGTNGDPDLTTKDGRVEAVRQRVAKLRKDFPGEELETVLGKRRQSIEEYARQELATEHPKIDFLKD